MRNIHCSLVIAYCPLSRFFFSSVYCYNIVKSVAVHVYRVQSGRYAFGLYLLLYYLVFNGSDTVFFFSFRFCFYNGLSMRSPLDIRSKLRQPKFSIKIVNFNVHIAHRQRANEQHTCQ